MNPAIPPPIAMKHLWFFLALPPWGVGSSCNAINRNVKDSLKYAENHQLETEASKNGLFSQ